MTRSDEDKYKLAGQRIKDSMASAIDKIKRDKQTEQLKVFKGMQEKHSGSNRKEVNDKEKYRKLRKS